MKCPNCGAETNNKVCEFCNSEIPQEKQNINITNNYYNCNSELYNDDNALVGKCPKCNSEKISFKREKMGTSRTSNTSKKLIFSGSKGYSSSHSSYRTIGLCQNCGYTWIPNSNNESKKTAPLWLWILGWIFIFPVPLTIILLKKKEMKPIFK